MSKEIFTGKLSRDLPGKKVAVAAGAEEKPYYKYYLEEFHDIPKEMKDQIRASVFKKGEGLELADRRRMDEAEAFPANPGYYPLKGGGCLSCANVKTPDLTGEMLGWWSDWHGLDPLRYAIWDPEDHYDLEVVENKERLLDDSIPFGERVWTTKHKIWESMDANEPDRITMIFMNPYKDLGLDESLRGTERDLYTVAAQGYIGNVPSVAIERLCKGADGINEMRCRFWIGYEIQEDKSIKYKLPFFVKPPKNIVHNLIIHNYREFSRLNEILPRLYAEQKDEAVC